jgi:hypothetical protein
MDSGDSREEPLTMDDSDNEGTDNGISMSSYAVGSMAASMTNATSSDSSNRQQPTNSATSSLTSSHVVCSAPTPSSVSHQAMLRQQAHFPVGLSNRLSAASSNNNLSVSVSNPNAYSHQRLDHLEDLNISSEQRHSFASPEHGVNNDNDPNSPMASSTTNGWSVVETNGGTPPSARSLHAAALLNGVMYVFGGYDGVSRVNTFHAFSFAEKRWSPVLPSATSASPPSPRDRHVAFSFGNSFYVHGGFDGTSRVSDFWGFDFSSMTWREVVVLAGRPPSPRHSHAAVVHRHSLYIFGGYDGSYK